MVGSAMFVNRFTFMHPSALKLLSSARRAAGDCAGRSFMRNLALPIGTHDFKLISGENLDLEICENVPHLFLGGPGR
jgi:hypothetical protein